MTMKHDQIVAEVQTQFRCPHEHSEIRRKTDKAGRPMLARQCLLCGQQLGAYEPLKRYTGKQIEAFVSWDERLEIRRGENYASTLRRRCVEEKDRQRSQFLKRHDAFLKSEVWRKLRLKILDRAESLCEGCGEAKATQVHHLNYDRW